jgi:hypothetical protein
LRNAGCYPGERPQGVPLVFYCCGFVQNLLNESRFYLLFTFRFVSVFLTQGSRTSKPPKAKKNSNESSTKRPTYFSRKVKKNVKASIVLG